MANYNIVGGTREIPKLVKAETIDKQIIMKKTKYASTKNGLPRIVHADQKYMVKTAKEYSDGHIEYTLYDGTVMAFDGGSAGAAFSYTSGYVDFIHAKRNREKAKAAEEKKSYSALSEYDKRNKAIAKSLNKKETDSIAATDDNISESGSAESTASSGGVDASQYDEIKNKTVRRILMESGDYVRTVDASGREVFATDENGKFILNKTRWSDYEEGDKSVLDSKYGGNITKAMSDLSGIHGMPYRFLPSADISYGNSSVGRVYKKHVLDRTPLLLLTPGVPKFMDDFDDDEKDDIIKAMGKQGSSVVLDQLIGDESGMYYTFEFKFAEYYEYVNTMLNAMANMLGVGGVGFMDSSLGTFKWQRFANPHTRGIVTARQSVPFYIDAQTQATETFSNTTGESALAENVNSVSTFAKEMQFVLGGVGSAKFKELVESGVDSALSGLSSALASFNNILPNRIINKLIGGFGTLISGGKILFPEIWQDSQFTKTQDVSIKLSSPSGDNVSIFINILVPLIHIICLAAPRQMGPNGYQAPYIVRAWYKSMFSTDMGIIDNLTVTRGDKGKWNKDGLPLSLEVQFTIKDLYSSLSITKRDGIFGTDLIQNPLLLSYMSTLCGINSYKPDILRTFDLYKTAVQNIPSDIFTGIQDNVLNGLTNVFNVESPGVITTLAGTTVLSLINNFKPKKNPDGKAVPIMPNGFMGVERLSGMNDDDYAKLVMTKLQEHDLKIKQQSFNNDISKINKEMTDKGKEYKLPEFKLKTVEEFKKAYPNANNDAYAKYTTKEVTDYEKKIADAKKKKEESNKPKPKPKP